MTAFPNLYRFDSNGKLIEVSTGREVSIVDVRAGTLLVKENFNIKNAEATIIPKTRRRRSERLSQVDLSKKYYQKARKNARPYDRFEVRYRKRIENEDVEYVYAFSLLPAIDTTVRTSGQGVPDATPGIKFQTEMNYQRHLIPGAPPVYQSMGIKGRYVYLVGTFLGVEKNVKGVTTQRPKPSLLDIKMTENDRMRPSVTSFRPNSYETSVIFDKDVIQNGRPVELIIFSDSDRTDESLHLKIYGVIESMRLFCVRADRTYYALTVSSLQFQWGPKIQKTPEEKQQEQNLNELINEVIPVDPNQQKNNPGKDGDKSTTGKDGDKSTTGKDGDKSTTGKDGNTNNTGNDNNKGGKK